MNKLSQQQELQLERALGFVLMHAVNEGDNYTLNRVSYAIETLWGTKARGSLNEWLVQCGEEGPVVNIDNQEDSQ